MAGDTQQINQWVDADIYVGAIDATDPATIDDEFGMDWDLVGILDGDAGLPETPEWGTQDEFFGWGVGLVRRGFRNFKLTKKFTPLESIATNDTVRGLVWPGSSDTEIVVPVIQRIAIAFEVVDTSLGIKMRKISHNAEISVDGDLPENESDITRYPLAATIYADGEGKLFDFQTGELASA